MRDLYDRLSTAGFDRKLVRSILPDWWDDTLASSPYNRALAEGVIASHLPFAVARLRDPSAALSLTRPEGACFKRNRGSDVTRCLPSFYVAKRAASLVASNVPAVPPFSGGVAAVDVRRQVLAGASTVDLSSLADYCWRAGVPVVPVALLSRKLIKFDGVAMWCGGRPVIVLASGRDGPPWLAFDLAHELGHVMLGHVGSGTGAHVDCKLRDGGEDAEEREADRFASELLTGDPAGFASAPVFGLTGPALAAAARQHVAGTGTDPGAVCLYYGRSAGRWGAAQAALKELGLDTGGARLLATSLAAHLDPDGLAESAARFLEATCHLPPGVTDDNPASVR